LTAFAAHPYRQHRQDDADDAETGKQGGRAWLPSRLFQVGSSLSLNAVCHALKAVCQRAKLIGAT
jgi:hypothetical protein